MITLKTHGNVVMLTNRIKGVEAMTAVAEGRTVQFRVGKRGKWWYILPHNTMVKVKDFMQDTYDFREVIEDAPDGND